MDGFTVGLIIISFQEFFCVFADQRYRWDITRGIKPSEEDQNMRLQIKPSRNIIWSWPNMLGLVNTCWPSLWQLETTKKQRAFWRKVNIFLLLAVLTITVLAGGLEGVLILACILVLLTFIAGFYPKKESDPVLLWAKARGPWNAAKAGIILCMLTILMAGLLASLFLMQFYYLNNTITSGWIVKLTFGLFLDHSIGANIVKLIINCIIVMGITYGLEFSGLTFIKQIVLRFLLYTTGYTPRNYLRFLDDAVDRQLLRKIGRRYIFVHRLLMEHFILSQYNKTNTANALSTLESLVSLEELYHSKGLLEDEIPLSHRILAIHEQIFGANELITAYYIDYLASLYCDLKQYEKALSHYQRALAIKEQKLKSYHPGIARSIETLADFYLSQGQYQEAELLSQRALTLHEQENRSEDLVSAITDLANIYIYQGRFEDAEQYLQRALTPAAKGTTDEEISLSSFHPFTIQAKLYSVQGQYEKAEEILIKIFTTFKKSLKLHPYNILNLILMAELYIDQGKYAKAEELIRFIRTKEEQLPSNDMATTFLILKIRATISILQGQPSEAELLLQQSKSIQEQNPEIKYLPLLKMYKKRRNPLKDVLEDI